MFTIRNLGGDMFTPGDYTVYEPGQSPVSHSLLLMDSESGELRGCR
ncbi:MAG: hypothetical protein U0703_06620 [Anaerolineae bacterium]